MRLGGGRAFPCAPRALKPSVDGGFKAARERCCCCWLSVVWIFDGSSDYWVYCNIVSAGVWRDSAGWLLQVNDGLHE